MGDIRYGVTYFYILCGHLYCVSFIDLYASTWDLYLFFGGQKNLDEAHSSPGLHASAGPGLAEECATLVGSFVHEYVFRN